MTRRAFHRRDLITLLVMLLATVSFSAGFMTHAAIVGEFR